MNGLSSTALQNTTSLAAPRPSAAAVSCAACLITRPIIATASMLIPALVEPMLTDAHTRSVCASASGIASISARSPAVKPLCTRAEKPPMKLTPISRAARSSAWATPCIESRNAISDTPSAITATGVTETRVLVTGMPYSRAIAWPAATRVWPRRHTLS